MNTVLKKRRHAFGHGFGANHFDRFMLLNQFLNAVGGHHKLVNAHSAFITGFIARVASFGAIQFEV
ncbi:MAG TPA: hypothetical protein DDZ34_06985, partial [Syntrophaceae bacterium]|nr:hypothetical protein [Syntrophaceae bacterium]